MSKYVRRVIHRFMVAESMAAKERYKYTYSSTAWAANKLHYLNKDEVVFEQPLSVNDEFIFINNGYISKKIFEISTKVIGKLKW